MHVEGGKQAWGKGITAGPAILHAPVRAAGIHALRNNYYNAVCGSGLQCPGRGRVFG